MSDLAARAACHTGGAIEDERVARSESPAATPASSSTGDAETATESLESGSSLLNKIQQLRTEQAALKVTKQKLAKDMNTL